MTFHITDEVIERVETYAAQGLSEEQIATMLGCGRTTLHRRKKDNETFETAIKRGKAQGVENVTNALYEKAMKGDNISMIFWLKNRDRDNWKDKQDVAHSGEVKIERIERTIKDPAN